MTSKTRADVRRGASSFAARSRVGSRWNCHFPVAQYGFVVTALCGRFWLSMSALRWRWMDRTWPSSGASSRFVNSPSLTARSSPDCSESPRAWTHAPDDPEGEDREEWVRCQCKDRNEPCMPAPDTLFSDTVLLDGALTPREWPIRSWPVSARLPSGQVEVCAGRDFEQGDWIQAVGKGGCLWDDLARLGGRDRQWRTRGQIGMSANRPY